MALGVYKETENYLNAFLHIFKNMVGFMAKLLDLLAQQYFNY